MDNYHYAIIGNSTSAALISKDGSIDWLCLPFFDSPSLFARLLDQDKGGHFKITGVDTVRVSSGYISNTPIFKTVIETADGVLEIRDYMPRFVEGQDNYYCPPEIHRDILVVSGRPRVRIELVPRPNYALGEADLRCAGDYIKIISRVGEYNSFYLYSNIDHQRIIDGQPCELPEKAYILLSYNEKMAPVNGDKIYLEYEKTKTYWLDWVSKIKFPPRHKEMVLRSMVTLKLLMFQRTGAVIAAPTTSLPEIIGKDRNWDYRFCWVRDASMIIDLYLRVGDARSATRFINFILNRMLLKHDNIAVMYGINGEKELTEQTLDHLAGYEGSRPVRIGNAAYFQKQNDVYGEMIEMIYAYFVVNKRAGIAFDEEIWTVVRSLVRDVQSIWQEPDSGIWERRQDLEHYVHSKMMSWVAVDRAIKIARFIGRPEYVERWAPLAEQIRQDILTKGWNEELQSFTMSYGSKMLDASNLLMLHYGFLDRRDPRMVSTVQKTYEHLVRNQLTFRYLEEDEFGAPENAFIVCNFWMINALYLIGEVDRAREMFDHILGFANQFGLYAEDIEVATGRLTGNFPQGYSHLALVQTALLLETEYNWSDAVLSSAQQRDNGWAR